MHLKTVIKGLIIFAFILILYAFHQRLWHISPEDIRTFIYMAGWFAPAFYLLLFMLRPLVLFPASVFSIVGGLAFGAWWGSLLAFTGATLGAILAFYVARFVGEDAFKKLKNEKVIELKRNFEKKGFFYILMLRFLPIVNFDLISYGCGLSQVKFRHFLKATMIGIIPGTLIYNFLGASLVVGNRWTVTFVIIVYVILIIAPIIWRKNIMNKIEEMDEKMMEGS